MSVTVKMQILSSVRVSMNIVKWSSQGMLRLTQEAMNELFQPTIINIVKHIGEKHTHTDCGVAHIHTLTCILTVYTDRTKQLLPLSSFLSFSTLFTAVPLAKYTQKHLNMEVP